MTSRVSLRRRGQRACGVMLVLAAAAAVLPTGCGGSATAPDDAVAVFDGGWVTAAEVAGAAEGSGARPSRLASLREAGADEVARWIAWEKLVAAERRDEVERRREWLIRARELEREPLLSRLRDQLATAVEVTDEEVEAEIAATRSLREATQARLEIRYIFLRASDDIPADERQRKLALARRLVDELRGGASFEELARRHSESGTAANGGLIPGIRPGATDPAFEQVVFGLDEGEVSDVIVTASGYHIARLEKRTETEPVDEARLRENLPERLRTRKTERAIAELVEDLRQAEEAVARWSPDGRIDPRPGDDAVLVVDDFVFTADDLGRARAQAGVPLQRPDQVAAFLDRLLEQELLYREALRRFQPTRREREPIRELAERTARIDLALIDEEADLIAAVPPADLAEFLLERPEPLQTVESYRARVIFLADGTNVWETFREAERLVARLRSGADFATLAEQRSQGPNADAGGDLGDVAANELMAYDPELVNALMSLEPGEISDPVRIPENRLSTQPGSLPSGFVIITLLDRRKPRPLDLETDEDEIRRRYWVAHRAELLTRRRDQALAAADFRLLASADEAAAADLSAGR